MTTSACSSSNITVAYPVGGSGALVTFLSYTANQMSLGVSQQPFGPIGDGGGNVLGPATTVNAVAWAQATNNGTILLPGVIALN